LTANGQAILDSFIVMFIGTQYSPVLAPVMAPRVQGDVTKTSVADDGYNGRYACARQRRNLRSTCTAHLCGGTFRTFLLAGIHCAGYSGCLRRASSQPPALFAWALLHTSIQFPSRPPYSIAVLVSAPQKSRGAGRPAASRPN
jgi:hypothetical protein